MDENYRQPHAVLDLDSRRLKGEKIERLLGLSAMPAPIRLLEVGTGSGGIAHYFGTHPALRCDVDAVDIHDSRRVRDGFRFRLVDGTALPFQDGYFDVVLSNHVIEHVGGEAEQRAHLEELHRVIHRDGVGYLAVPNRWMLVEPHYGLAFLSWLPRQLRTPYLRFMKRGRFYDCEPLRMGELERLLDETGFRYTNMCIEATRETLELEQPRSWMTRLVRSVPSTLLIPFRRIVPTLIYRLEP